MYRADSFSVEHTEWRLIMLMERMLDTSNVVLNIAESMADGTPLLLLHGATQNWQCFSEFLPSLEQHWHIYVPDLRGHSKSGWVPSAYHACG
jgi:pimeloyl-ACP methyl ester carboxylesterase